MIRTAPLIVTLLLAACAGPRSNDLYLPTYGPMNGHPAGEIQGTLVGEEIPPPCREAGLYWLGYDLKLADD